MVVSPQTTWCFFGVQQAIQRKQYTPKIWSWNRNPNRDISWFISCSKICFGNSFFRVTFRGVIFSQPEMEPLDRWLVIVCWLCNQSILVCHHYHDFERCPSQESLGKPSKTTGNNVDSAGTSHQWTGKNEISREVKVKHDHSKKILSGMLCLL